MNISQKSIDKSGPKDWNELRRLVGFPVTTGLLSPCRMVVYSAQDRQPTERELHVGEVRIFKKLSPHWYYLHCR